jgi:hypothetical protein
MAQWGGLFCPVDILEQPDGTFLVTDQVPSLTCFAPDGERLGRCRPSLNGAHGMARDGLGNLYLAETQPSAVTKMRLPHHVMPVRDPSSRLSLKFWRVRSPGH